MISIAFQTGRRSKGEAAGKCGIYDLKMTMNEFSRKSTRLETKEDLASACLQLL